MTTNYKHTQIGYFSIVVIGSATLFLTAYFSQIGINGENWGLSVIIGIMLICLINFSTLTVEITREEVIWYFGPGFWKYRIKLSEIKAIARTRSHPFEGIGIRWNPWRGWLYNVSGLNAVKITRKKGKSTRIGTNQPQHLLEAIQKAAAMAGNSALK